MIQKFHLLVCIGENEDTNLKNYCGLVTKLCLTLVTPWTVTCQAPLSMGFSRQEYWIGSPFPPPGDLPNPGIELVSLMSPALPGVFFTTSTTEYLNSNILANSNYTIQ